MSPRSNRTSRRPPVREARERLLVFCGGLRTERDYLKALNLWADNPAVAVTLKARASSPAQLVVRASEARQRSRSDFDGVWCVFDVDDFPLDGIVEAAVQGGVELAVSNPCFELWLLLHFTDCGGHLKGYDAVVAKLRRHVPGYDKARLEFGRFEGGVADAVERGKKLGTDHTVNPSTGVWRLVERVIG